MSGITLIERPLTDSEVISFAKRLGWRVSSTDSRVVGQWAALAPSGKYQVGYNHWTEKDAWNWVIALFRGEDMTDAP